MPTSVPRSIRQAWGEEATEDFTRWFEESLRERAVMRDEYREVLSRMDGLDQRMDGIDQRMDGLDQRMSRLEQRMGRLEEELSAFRRETDRRLDRIQEAMRVQTRWTIGTISLIGTILAALLAIAEFA